MSRIRSTHADIVGVIETKKDSFTPGYLRSLTGIIPFSWSCLPAKGTTGEILVCCNSDKFSVLGYVRLDFSISLVIKDVKSNFVWKLVVVYGSPYEAGKLDFLNELHEIMSKSQEPTMLAGDFNLVRFLADKSNSVINYRWAQAFNEWVDKWALVELNPSNIRYTWTNKQDCPILAKIDRIFVTTGWEQFFPSVKVKGLDKPPSDHNPLLIDTGDNAFFGKKIFRFEKWWVQKESFTKIVGKAWAQPYQSANSVDVWQFRIRTFRSLARGWAANEVASMNREKVLLALEYNTLEKDMESRALTDHELLRLKQVTRELDNIWALEEIKAKQRSRDRDIAEGDRNTAYFQAIANHRSRKKRVEVLEGPNGLVADQKGMMSIAVDFYKTLFAKENRIEAKFNSDFWSIDELVTKEENELLIQPFSEEVKQAIFNCYSDGAPGPDGISFMFYQKFWDIVKKDLLAMFNDFHQGRLDLHRLNFAMITLIPKEEAARSMKKFRPISLINCSFKIFSKVLTLRLGKVINRLIAPQQSAFI